MTRAAQRANPAGGSLDMNRVEFNAGLDMPLDRGIRRYVHILLDAGIETFESCEGGSGHAFPDPTIKFFGNHWEGFKAMSVAMTHGLPVMGIRLCWDMDNGMPHGPWWEIVFHAKDHEAD
jgi:hypothetical protein